MQARDDVAGLLRLVDVAVDGWLGLLSSASPPALFCHTLDTSGDDDDDDDVAHIYAP